MAPRFVDSQEIMVGSLPTGGKRHGHSSLDETDGGGGMNPVKTDTPLLAGTSGHILRQNENRQRDDRRPLTLFPDGRLGDVQCSHDFSTHLKDLLALFPGHVRI